MVIFSAWHRDQMALAENKAFLVSASLTGRAHIAVTSDSQDIAWLTAENAPSNPTQFLQIVLKRAVNFELMGINAL